MKMRANKAVGLVCGVAAALIIAGGMALVGSQSAKAKPEFAAQTGLSCGQCHVSPAGGGALKPLGQKFKANGFKLKK